MTPELMANDLVDYLWVTNTGKLFAIINDNGFLITQSGVKWSIDPEYNNRNLEAYADKKFYSIAQQQIKPLEKLTKSCLPMFDRQKIIGHGVVVDFIIKMLNEDEKEIHNFVSIVFTHTLPKKKSKLRLMC